MSLSSFIVTQTAPSTRGQGGECHWSNGGQFIDLDCVRAVPWKRGKEDEDAEDHAPEFDVKQGPREDADSW